MHAGCSPELWERIRAEGVGYMANTDEKKKLNVKVTPLRQDRQGIYPDILTYVALRDIKQYEEILAPYNNTESVKMQKERTKKKKKNKSMLQAKLNFASVKQENEVSIEH
jgi:hypothetical protein